jgi:choline dehydrogenase-like flavoprotein
MGMGSVSITRGLRETSASAYLSKTPPNLNILTDTQVTRVIFSGKKAIGVETVSRGSSSPGGDFFAHNEVILCAGAINTPHILMLSGIGEESELKEHNIALVHSSPMVGQNLQDHCFSPVGVILQKEDIPLSLGPSINTPSPMGWLKLPSVLSHPTFKELPDSAQIHLHNSTVPTIEIATHMPPNFLSPEPLVLKENEVFLGAIAILMNPQSSGTVELRSSNPLAKPLIDPDFLYHPYDQVALVHGLRETIHLLHAPLYKHRIVRTLGPRESATDQEIWEYVSRNLHSAGDMAGTACMGPDPELGVVNSTFEVYGVEGLRVVDLSVLPDLVSAHTQSVGYVLAEIAAEMIAVQYELRDLWEEGVPGFDSDTDSDYANF